MLLTTTKQSFLQGPGAVGTVILYNGARVTVTKVTLHKGGPDYYIYFKYVARGLGNGDVRSDSSDWELIEGSHTPPAGPPKKKLRTSHPQLVIQFLHACFRSPQVPCDKFEFIQFDSSANDKFSAEDFASVPMFQKGLPHKGKIYWGERSLRFTKFMATERIDTFVNIPSYQVGGLCQDTAIREYSNPNEQGERVMDEIRQIFRMFIKLPDWKELADLRGVGVDSVLEALKLGIMTERNWSLGCGRGRTRSGTVAMAMKLLLHIANLILAASSDDSYSSGALSELSCLSSDVETLQLGSIRQHMDAAMVSRVHVNNAAEDQILQGPMVVDRHDRFYCAVRCFCVGLSYTDGVLKVYQAPKTKRAAVTPVIQREEEEEEEDDYDGGLPNTPSPGRLNDNRRRKSPTSHSGGGAAINRSDSDGDKSKGNGGGDAVGNSDSDGDNSDEGSRGTDCCFGCTMKTETVDCSFESCTLKTHYTCSALHRENHGVADESGLDSDDDDLIGPRCNVHCNLCFPSASSPATKRSTSDCAKDMTPGERNSPIGVNDEEPEQPTISPLAQSSSTSSGSSSSQLAPPPAPAPAPAPAPSTDTQESVGSENTMQFKDLLDVHHIMNQIPNLDEALATISLPANQVPTEYAHPRVGKKLTIAKCKAINDDKGCDAWWYDAGTYRCLRAYVDKPPSSASAIPTVSVPFSQWYFSKLPSTKELVLPTELHFELLLATYHGRKASELSSRLLSTGNFYLLENGSMAYCTLMLKPVAGKNTVLIGRESKMVLVSLSVVGAPDTSTVNSGKDRQALFSYQQLILLPTAGMGEQVDVDSVLNTEFNGKVDCMVAWVKSAAQQTVQFLLHPVLCDCTMFKGFTKGTRPKKNAIRIQTCKGEGDSALRHQDAQAAQTEGGTNEDCSHWQW